MHLLLLKIVFNLHEMLKYVLKAYKVDKKRLFVLFNLYFCNVVYINILKIR